MQLSYACAYLLGEASYPWHELFENVLEWQNLIQCEEHRVLYTNVVHSLWGRLSTLREKAQDTDYSVGRLLALPPVLSQDLGGLNFDPESLLSIPQGLTSHSVHTPSQEMLKLTSMDTTVHPILRQGVVIRACREYLDGMSWSSLLLDCVLLIMDAR